MGYRNGPVGVSSDGDSCLALLPKLDYSLKETCGAQYHRRAMLFAFFGWVVR